MSKKISSKILWGAIIAVAILDAFPTQVAGWFPAVGDAVAFAGNTIWELIELALIFGLIKNTK